jgi:hypothetical protein
LQRILCVRLISCNCDGKPNQSLSRQVEHLRQRALRLLRQATNADLETSLKFGSFGLAHGIVKSRENAQFVCRNWKFSPGRIFSRSQKEQPMYVGGLENGRPQRIR